jgi:hypothetical protein
VAIAFDQKNEKSKLNQAHGPKITSQSHLFKKKLSYETIADEEVGIQLKIKQSAKPSISR